MAPEILLKQGHGKEADWWSLGILIYEMLVGLPPFYQENTRKAYEALLTQPIEFPSNVSPEARRMVRGLAGRWGGSGGVGCLLWGWKAGGRGARLSLVQLNVDSSKRLGKEDTTDEQVGYDASSIERKWKNVSWLEPVSRGCGEWGQSFGVKGGGGPGGSNVWQGGASLQAKSSRHNRCEELLSKFHVSKANDVFSDFQYVAPVWTVLSSPELHPPHTHK
eukprot:114537-Hanusia_phi.AAC.1